MMERRSIPCLYAILTHKSQRSYTALLNWISLNAAATNCMEHTNLWKFIAKLNTCQKKEVYYLEIIRHGQSNAVHDRPKKAYQLKEDRLILITANYKRGVYDNKADFLQAVAETQ
jgi:hypothetical protein